MRYITKVTNLDRLMSALSYLTAGWVGLGYCIVLHLTHKTVSNFMRFNLMQSIFIAIAYFLISVLLNFVLGILSHIPFIQIVVAWIQLIFFRPVIFHYSILGLAITLFMAYCVVFCLLGKRPLIYFVSDLFKERYR